MKQIFKLNSIIFFSLLSLVFTACEKEIVLDLHESEPEIVIEGVIPKDSLATVWITKSKNFDDVTDYAPVEGALVTISDNAGNEENLIQDPVSGLYLSTKIKGVEGRVYNLKIKIEDVEYTSTSKMPYAVPMDTLYLYKINSSFKDYYPQIEIQDPKGIENFYRHILYINGNRIRMIDVTSDKDRDGVLLQRLIPFDTKDNNDNGLKIGDLVMVETQCIDKGVYTFFETWGRMGQTLANPTSNIKGGALGYFSAYTFDRKDLIVDKE